MKTEEWISWYKSRQISKAPAKDSDSEANFEANPFVDGEEENYSRRTVPKIDGIGGLLQ